MVVGQHSLEIRIFEKKLFAEKSLTRNSNHRILRHKNLATTERYIQHINDDLAETMDLLGMAGVPQGSTPNKKRVNRNDG